jgi:hypothetical protein
VCCLAEFLTHAPCLAKVKDGLERCDRTFNQKVREGTKKMEEQGMKQTKDVSPENDREGRTVCW